MIFFASNGRKYFCHKLIPTYCAKGYGANSPDSPHSFFNRDSAGTHKIIGHEQACSVFTGRTVNKGGLTRAGCTDHKIECLGKNPMAMFEVARLGRSIWRQRQAPIRDTGTREIHCMAEQAVVD